jgi:hypothetical protein
MELSACSFGWWLIVGADLFWEKSTAGWSLVAGLFWEKNTTGWWLISRTNRLCRNPCRLYSQAVRNASCFRWSIRPVVTTLCTIVHGFRLFSEWAGQKHEIFKGLPSKLPTNQKSKTRDGLWKMLQLFFIRKLQWYFFKKMNQHLFEKI